MDLSCLRTMKFYCTAIFTAAALVTRGNSRHHHNDYQCRDFTFNDCTYEVTDMITSSIGQDENFCQFLCSVTYADLCVYFLYDDNQKMCQIFKGAMQNPRVFCSRVGGPSNTSLSKCQSHDQKCQVPILRHKTTDITLNTPVLWLVDSQWPITHRRALIICWCFDRNLWGWTVIMRVK